MMTKLITPQVFILEVRAPNNPEGKPIVFLLIERSETVEHDKTDGSICRASITLSYKCFGAAQAHRFQGGGTIVGGYARHADGVSNVSLLTSGSGEGALFIDPIELRGNRVGTYLLNQIVTWAKQWPDATVRKINLLAAQAHGENKIIRNKLYEQFGIRFQYEDGNKEAGFSLPIFADSLIQVVTWQENLKEHDLYKFLNEIGIENASLKFELVQRERAIKELLTGIRQAESKPAGWAFLQLISKLRRVTRLY